MTDYGWTVVRGYEEAMQKREKALEELAGNLVIVIDQLRKIIKEAREQAAPTAKK